MASYFLLTLLFTSTIAAATATAITPTPAGNCCGKSTTMRFFIREITTGPNATIRTIVPPLNNNSSFGAITVVDDEIRSGPNAMSQLIGRAQGLGVGTSMDSSTVSSSGTLVFTEGQYSGSTLAYSGLLNLIGQPFVLSIIGGTGQFRLARGYTINTFVIRTTGTIVYGVTAVICTPYN